MKLSYFSVGLEPGFSQELVYVFVLFYEFFGMGEISAGARGLSIVGEGCFLLSLILSLMCISFDILYYHM